MKRSAYFPVDSTLTTGACRASALVCRVLYLTNHVVVCCTCAVCTLSRLQQENRPYAVSKELSLPLHADLACVFCNDNQMWQRTALRKLFHLTEATFQCGHKPWTCFVLNAIDQEVFSAAETVRCKSVPSQSILLMSQRHHALSQESGRFLCCCTPSQLPASFELWDSHRPYDWHCNLKQCELLCMFVVNCFFPQRNTVGSLTSQGHS